MKRLLNIGLVGIISCSLILSGLNVTWQPGFNLPDFNISTAKADAGTTVTANVSASSDDCKVSWNGAAWSLWLDNTVQDVGYSTSSACKKGGGMRFLNIDIPNGATIIAANFTVVSGWGDTGTPVYSIITGEKTSSPATFSDIANYQGRRGTVVGGDNNTSLTCANVTWNNISPWTITNPYTSPDISSIVQEIVNLPEWVGDGTDDVVLFWDDHDGNSTGGYDYRRAASWDNETYNEPVLSITYTTIPRTGITKISVDSGNHTTYGLSYPMTYKFSIPPGSSNLTAWKRHDTSSGWTQLTENTSSDFFNGIECVRFDYPNQQAYISTAFSNSSEDIYIKILDSEEGLVDSIYAYTTEYYDNRKAVVTVTMDDWKDEYADDFTSACDLFQSRSIWASGGIVTSSCNSTTWADIQTQIDEGFIEAASHSRTHPHVPYGDYEGEIDGSRLDITGNLTLPAIYTSGSSEYVYAWLEPYGDSDATARAQIGSSKYLCDRDYSMPANPNLITFETWDDSNGLYNIVLYTIEIGEDDPYGTDNVTLLNLRYDQAYTAGGIYHLMVHPWNLDFSPGEYVQTHLDYIKEKKDIWYVGFGALYLYHYVQEHGILTVTEYSEEEVSAPTLTTNDASSIEATTATLSGNITATGGENADYRGFEWDTDSGAPYTDNWTEGGSFGTGEFTHGITGLPEGNTIYFRAIAHNSEGWGVGDEGSLLTKPAAPTNVAATDGDSTDNVTITWTKSTGATDYQVYRDGDALGWLGDVATHTDTGANTPTITAGTASATDGDYAAYVELTLSGESANNGTTHTYKVRAKNDTGESADSSTDTGFVGVGSLTFQWQRSAADSDADYSNIDGATTETYQDTGAPENGDGRYFKCVLNATGASENTSTSDRGYRAVLSTPTVATANATSIGDTYATLNGSITDTGGENCDYRGWEWGLSTGNYTANWTASGSFGTGSYSHQVTSFSENTTYYFRAMAHNSEGWGYGSELDFTTELTPEACDAPSNFTYTQTGLHSANLTWTKGDGANNTVIRGSLTEYPESVTDGFEIYSDNGSWVMVEDLNFSLEKIYLRAWSQCNPYSDDYADLTIGGGALESISDSIISFTDLIEGLIGLAIAGGITFLAYWHRDHWLYYLAGIIALVFGFMYFTTQSGSISYYVGISLVLFGIYNFIKGTWDRQKA